MSFTKKGFGTSKAFERIRGVPLAFFITNNKLNVQSREYESRKV